MIGILLKGDNVEKIAMFYRCHIPPAFNSSDSEKVSVQKSLSGKHLNSDRV